MNFELRLAVGNNCFFVRVCVIKKAFRKILYDFSLKVDPFFPNWQVVKKKTLLWIFRPTKFVIVADAV